MNLAPLTNNVIQFNKDQHMSMNYKRKNFKFPNIYYIIINNEYQVNISV